MYNKFRRKMVGMIFNASWLVIGIACFLIMIAASIGILMAIESQIPIIWQILAGLLLFATMLASGMMTIGSAAILKTNAW